MEMKIRITEHLIPILQSKKMAGGALETDTSLATWWAVTYQVLVSCGMGWVIEGYLRRKCNWREPT